MTCENECSEGGLKKCSGNGYQTCGNYDTDSCLEWSSITNCSQNTMCQNGICVQQKCSDETLYGQCSTNKPKYCDNGNLISKCSMCGCVPGEECQSNEMCELFSFAPNCQTNFKMAFVLVARNETELTPERIDKIDQIKNYFSSDFHIATQNLAYMDTSYNIITMVDDGSLISDQNYVIESAVTKKFYKSNPDTFDFISIYTAFDTQQVGQHHLTVKNNMKGIGPVIYDSSAQYGSNSKLLGINSMNNIDMYNPDPSSFRSSGLLHETGHQWCCYVGDDYSYGPKDSNLPILGSHNIHWHCITQVADLSTNQRDPMGGCYWTDNGNGTFTRNDLFPKVEVFHNLTLYLIGLLPKERVPNIKLVIPEQDPPYWQWYEPIKASSRYISINDIITKYGETSCKLEKSR